MWCLAGASTLQMITEQSNPPVATNLESGDHAAHVTLAVWNPHSLLCGFS